ncbi:hypothetical protein [Novosphingobium sp. 9]|uniref:hypothetical protein n=1 Tax=Novosphingobium sp. 9 TaxID=2025349 RepID=UPI0021B51896|nr:hypothetical protein [Novosphingobium sp. 9]
MAGTDDTNDTGSMNGDNTREAGDHGPEDQFAATGSETMGEDDLTSPRRTVWQRVRMRLLKTVIAAILGVIALAALIVFGINTGPGRRFVADQIGALKFANGMRITVGRIDGSLYSKMTLRDLSVRDPQGEFLFAPEINIDWRPFEYLDNHVNVRSATAQRVVLRRTPHFKQTPTDPNAPLLPDLDIDVGRLKVDRFVAEAPVAGKLRIVTVDGRAHISDGRAQVYADGGTIAVDGKEGGDRFRLNLDAVPDKNRLAIGLDVEAPTGGLIATMGGLKQPMTLRIDGKGDWATWNGHLTGQLGGGKLADLALEARNGTFHIKGPTQIAKLVTGPSAALLGPITDVDLSAAFEKRRATVSGLISSDAFSLTPNGVVDLGQNTFGDLKLAFVLRKATAIAPNLSGAGMRANLTLDGAFATPRSPM